MKKLNLIIVFLITITCYGQNCKAHISNKDEITEITTELWGGKLDSKSTIVNGKGYDIKLLIAMDKDVNKPYAILNIVNHVAAEDADIFDINFEEGAEYILKTEGGLIKLKIDKVFKSKKRFMSTFSVTNQIISSLTETDIKLLSTENISMFRVITENGQKLEGTVDKKNSKKLKLQFECFAKNNP
ncbi:MAG: hypothetical protein KDD23_03315 [Winogradskyella sp.]|uniref:hypothetical protein n=1 Tax=Xanthomarina gelatinilytica TaxID=1137281 RepID=UPI000D683C96|nr:hypothetical protein [Winogradskyella sp.]PWI30508.1 hypothetical protein DI383_03395 [Flavobacteriaceae bacterium LYZ1037]